MTISRMLFGLTLIAVLPSLLMGSAGCTRSSDKSQTGPPGLEATLKRQLPTSPVPPQVVTEDLAKKLLIAARSEKSHPGIILRYACQIPETSSLYEASDREMERAEKLWDTQIARELRREAATSLQNSYFESGVKVFVTVREERSPTMIMKSPLFDETTGLQFSHTGLEKQLGDKVLPLGIRRIDYINSVEGGGSSSLWTSEYVHYREFHAMESLCAEVRDQRKKPDSINSTVVNPR